MKKFNDVIIIGVDHGYGNIKTANYCFRTGITAYDSEPLFTKDMLVYGGKFYLIGEGHKEFLPDKIKDEDYYALTLVAIAKELSAEDFVISFPLLRSSLSKAVISSVNFTVATP